MIIGIIVALFSSLFNSCTPSDTIEGEVRDITKNTITIVTESDSVVTFSTRRAKMKGTTEAIRGSHVEISFSDDISDGFGNALIIESLTDGERE